MLEVQPKRTEDIDELFIALLNECVLFSEKFLTKPENIQFVMADYSSGCFVHVNVPAFTAANGKEVIFNRDWLKRSLPEYEDDVRFYVYHELRHIHQMYQIAKMNSKERTEEPTELISRWESDFKNYQTNYGDEESKRRNLAQEVEIDANAYALAMLNMKYADVKNWRFVHSLPQEAYEEADKRSREYYKTRPELKRICDKRVRDITGKIACGKKPERNDPCPCGSGRKFKQCCIDKGIYD